MERERRTDDGTYPNAGEELRKIDERSESPVLPGERRAKMDLKNIFTYHAPTPSQAMKYQLLREAALNFASILDECTPDGADKSAAIRHIREAVMTANAAIALDRSRWKTLVLCCPKDPEHPIRVEYSSEQGRTIFCRHCLQQYPLCNATHFMTPCDLPPRHAPTPHASDSTGKTWT